MSELEEFDCDRCGRDCDEIFNIDDDEFVCEWCLTEDEQEAAERGEI